MSLLHGIKQDYLKISQEHTLLDEVTTIESGTLRIANIKSETLQAETMPFFKILTQGGIIYRQY